MSSRRLVLQLVLTVVLLGLSIAPGRLPAAAEQSQIPPAEYDALVALYNATDGAHWTTPWTLPTDTPCSLHAVTCEDGHVTVLALGNTGLSGQIPPELADLGGLRYLGLEANQLSGPIPPELGSLTSLMYLGLLENQLSGPIPPELGDLASLETLSLGSNQLTGLIPPELGDLANLRVLNLGTNQLSGPIPPDLGDLASLQVLLLSSNLVSGPLPMSLMALSLFHIGYDDTHLCEPDDPAFEQWLVGIMFVFRTGVPCDACYLPTLQR